MNVTEDGSVDFLFIGPILHSRTIANNWSYKGLFPSQLSLRENETQFLHTTEEREYLLGRRRALANQSTLTSVFL